MSDTEHLLGILAEECAEVAIRASKAQRFGLGEVQPGQRLTNCERITYELNDLLAAADMLGIPYGDEAQKQAKQAKVWKFMEYAAECAALSHVKELVASDLALQRALAQARLEEAKWWQRYLGHEWSGSDDSGEEHSKACEGCARIAELQGLTETP